MNLLESEIFLKLLELCSLNYTDLLCVVFFDPSQLFHNRNPEGLKKQTSMNTSSNAIDGMIQEFITNISADELRAASLVVLEDVVLQQAILKEREALVSKGVFIPTLKSVMSFRRPHHTEEGNNPYSYSFDSKVEPSIDTEEQEDNIDQTAINVNDNVMEEEPVYINTTTVSYPSRRLS